MARAAQAKSTADASRTCRRCHIDKPLGSFERLPRGIRGVCHRCRDGKAPVAKVPRFARALRGQRYLITAAQNATPVHREFLAALEVAAMHLGAELVVVPLRYRNPTSRWSAAQESDEWWAPEVEPFLFNQRKKLHAHLVLAADVKTVPTASSPLSGFESLTGAESCIIGHPRMQFRAVPVPTGRMPKILSTTGVCTRANYTDSKAGKIGEFHHHLGAVLVELDGKRFHLRQINADRRTGSFIDLDKAYSPEGVADAPPALALVMGDTHVRVADPEVDAATFGPGGIVETLQPEVLVWHDLIDGETANPHDAGDPFIAEAKRRAGRSDIRAEIAEAAAFVRERAKGRRAVIVDSNHHAFLARWVVATDWRRDLRNAEFYLETAQLMLRSARMAPGGATYDDPFSHWMRELGAGHVRCLEADESYQVAGIELGMHGHRGPSGARGSLRNLSRLGAKVITGHSHTPGIEAGHYQVGTSSYRRLAYQRGPSRALNTHCVIYANGRRSLITIVDGAWRLGAQVSSRTS